MNLVAFLLGSALLSIQPKLHNCIKQTALTEFHPGFQVKAHHPLDPLSPSEIRTTVHTIETAEKNASYEYSYISLLEPPKARLLPYFLGNINPPLTAAPRKAFAVLIEKRTGFIFEAVVNLGRRRRESYTRIHNVQPPLNMFNDLEQLDNEVIKRNPEVRRRCASLGYPNTDLVIASGWSIGYIEDSSDSELLKGKRLAQYFMFAKNYPEDNHNAHPMDFLVIMDIDKQRVIEIQDFPTHNDFSTNNTGNTAPRKEGHYDYKFLGGESFLRKGDKPITTNSPEGPSYTLSGNILEWQKWKMHVGFNGREGIVLNMISYNDSGIHRPILYRASIAEMFTPYADPRPPHHRKTSYDLGEFGMGFNSNPQILNEDVLGSVHFLDQVLHNSSGTVTSFKKAVSVREEDAGILWKHTDRRTGKSITARSHRLAITLLVTVGHYDFVFNWFFYQDASIQFQAQLTGIPNVNMMAVGATSAGYGETVAPQINAQYHQHFFTTRLDFDVDGISNSVSTSDVVPYSQGQGFTVKETLLTTAAEGRTNCSPKTGRTWVISNPNPQKLHKYTGKPVGWKFIPENTPSLFMKNDSPIRRKATFLNYDTWVTPYEDGLLYPGGFYLNETGLPVVVQNKPDAKIDSTDLVFWNSFSLVHITRTEDWPITPVAIVGFWLKPHNFFKENPAIDVPVAIKL